MVGTSILIVLNDHFLFSDGSAATIGVAGNFLPWTEFVSEFPSHFVEPGLSKNQMMFSAEIL